MQLKGQGIGYHMPSARVQYIGDMILEVEGRELVEGLGFRVYVHISVPGNSGDSTGTSLNREQATEVLNALTAALKDPRLL